MKNSKCNESIPTMESLKSEKNSLNKFSLLKTRNKHIIKFKPKKDSKRDSKGLTKKELLRLDAKIKARDLSPIYLSKANSKLAISEISQGTSTVYSQTAK